jgi:chemotaxis-related protein WspB
MPEQTPTFSGQGMLALLFHIGGVRYMIRSDRVREIAPMVALKEAPHAPAYFSGYFNYRGAIVPVIDLCQLIQNAPCRMRLSTRIILVDYRRKGTPHILGLIAERVTEAVKKPKETFASAGIRSRKAPYLGGIIMEGDEMIQYLELDRLPDCIDFLPDSALTDGNGDDAERD